MLGVAEAPLICWHVSGPAVNNAHHMISLQGRLALGGATLSNPALCCRASQMVRLHVCVDACCQVLIQALQLCRRCRLAVADACCCVPVACLISPRSGVFDAATTLELVRFTQAANLTGLPALVMPGGRQLTGFLPVG